MYIFKIEKKKIIIKLNSIAPFCSTYGKKKYFCVVYTSYPADEYNKYKLV